MGFIMWFCGGFNNMDVNKILMEYDGMFGNFSLDEIEEFLVENIDKAQEIGDISCQFTLLNEIIGFFRDTTQKDKGIKYCNELNELMEEMGIEGKIEYATALLNIANAYRSFGLANESMDCYEKTLEIYKKNLKERDFGFANLYNNWALLYQEIGDLGSARDCLYKALAVVDCYEDAVIQQAITRANLGSTLVAIGDENSCQEAEAYLENALAIFEQDGGRDFHYNAALVAMGDFMCHKNSYEAGARYYQKGLDELEKHVGQNDNYAIVLEKLKYAERMAERMAIDPGIVQQDDEKVDNTGNKSKMTDNDNSKLYDNSTGDYVNRNRCVYDESGEWKRLLVRSREFYEKYGKRMIHEKFPEYESRIAVGMVGAGSDCFGFDDEISMDHDYGVGFCMWLTKEDYKEIGEQLHWAYEELLKEAGEYNEEYSRLADRRGVFGIQDFYEEYLGQGYNLEEGLYTYEDYQLAAATNGEVYRDDLGEFSSIRSGLLKYYNDKEWRHKLVKSLHIFSQCGQSNYARMMSRGDYVTANLCIYKAIEAAMDIAYLLAKSYAPYYKWKFKGIDKLIAEGKWQTEGKLSDINKLLEKLTALGDQRDAWEGVTYNPAVLNYHDKKIMLIDRIAEIILGELKAQDLAQGDDLFLQNYERQILTDGVKDRVSEIIKIEWEMFDKVKNEGGRADCQDDWNTFSLMRRSQYTTWKDELLESYLSDLIIARDKGWNIIMEKYARMMKSTCPVRYDELKKDLPEITRDRIEIQENIIDIQVSWMEEFASKYPKMAGNARSIRTETDSEYNTSYETYLRGELSTYSERTFVLYGRFVAELMRSGRNLAYEIMTNTAKLYGYKSVEDAESRL